MSILKQIGWHIKHVVIWGALFALLPLTAIHTGFWNLFLIISWLIFLLSFCVFVATIIIMWSIQSKEDYKKITNDDDRTRAIQTELAKHVAIPFAKKYGVDILRAETRHRPLDMVFIYAIVGWLVFTGHILLALLWLGVTLNISTKYAALKGFDDAMIEEL